MIKPTVITLPFVAFEKTTYLVFLCIRTFCALFSHTISVIVITTIPNNLNPPLAPLQFIPQWTKRAQAKPGREGK